ncbi:MAG: methyltransferase domain-containing protein, partial [Bacteroidota bacterium]
MSNIINTARLRQRKRRHFSSRNCRHDSYDWFIHDLAENELISRFKSYSQSFFPDIVLEKQCVVTRGFRPKLKLNHRGDFEGDVDASDIDETIIGSSISLSTFTEENDVLCDASSLPFLDGAIDVFLDSMELYLYNDVLASLQEVRRVLSDIGIYCCAFLGGET